MPHTMSLWFATYAHLAAKQDMSASKAMNRIQRHRPPGLGLIGIKIASDILSQVGGSVHVKAADMGTVVCVRLPLAE